MVEDTSFERASWKLAQLIEVTYEDVDKAVLVKACLWVLADCIVGVSRAERSSLDGSLRLCIQALTECTSNLAMVQPERLH